MQHTLSREASSDVIRLARHDVNRFGRITMMTAVILEARCFDVATLEGRLLAEKDNI
jgi:hypothetical protein